MYSVESSDFFIARTGTAAHEGIDKSGRTKSNHRLGKNKMKNLRWVIDELKVPMRFFYDRELARLDVGDHT